MLTIEPKHCAKLEQLKDEGLVVDPLPPFDLHVSFDWRTQIYGFEGQWMEGRPDDGYKIVLPGVKEAWPLEWNGHSRPISPTGITVDDCDLLRDRVFRVIRGQEVVMRGIVSELQTSARRAQHFESLEDLFDALAMGDEIAELGTLPFRIPLDTDTFADDTPDGPRPDHEETGPAPNNRAPLSYFRLFRSTHAFWQKLQSLDKLGAVNTSEVHRRRERS